MFDFDAGNLTEGPIGKILVVFSIPLVVQNLVRVVELMVDVFWLGRYGTGAVAAVGLASPPYVLLLSFVSVAPYLGTQITVSRRVGDEDHAAARRASFNGMMVAVLLSIAAILLFFAVSGPLKEILSVVYPGGRSDRTVTQAFAYLSVLVAGLLVTTLPEIVEATYVGWGNSKISLYMNVTAVVTDVVINPLLIFGTGPIPELGVRGAALSSVGGAIAGLLVGLVYAHTREGPPVLSVADYSVSVSDVKDVLSIGVPEGVQMGFGQIVGLAFVNITFVVGGTPGLAAYTVGARIASLASVPAKGLQAGVQSAVGQNVGAKKPARAREFVRIATGISLSTLTVLAVVQWFYPDVILNVIASDLSETASAYATEYLRLLVVGYPTLGVFLMLQGGFNGVGLTKVSSVASLTQSWVIELPIAVVGALLLNYGLDAIFWALPVSNVLGGVLLAAYYLYRVDSGLYGQSSESTTPT